MDASLDFTPSLNQRALDIAAGQIFPLGRGGASGSFDAVPIVGTLTELDFLTRNNEVSHHQSLAHTHLNEFYLGP